MYLSREALKHFIMRSTFDPESKSTNESRENYEEGYRPPRKMLISSDCHFYKIFYLNIEAVSK
jgi:hypothetical protein